MGGGQLRPVAEEVTGCEPGCAGRVVLGSDEVGMGTWARIRSAVRRPRMPAARHVPARTTGAAGSSGPSCGGCR